MQHDQSRLGGRWRRWLLGLLWIGACELSDPCDPGQYEEHGLCRALPVDGIDAGQDDDAGELADANTDPFAGFGTECTLQSECADFGLVCGESFLPYCTRTNCLGVAQACPPSWTCLNTGGAGPDPSVTSVCIQP